MNDHDIQLLAIGAASGTYLMLAVQVGFRVLDGRRDRKAARDAVAQLDAAVGRQKFPIGTHPYEGFEFEAPCTASGYGTACGATEYDHTETT